MYTGVKQQKEFLSTPSARRATIVHVVAQRVEDISIHALREEGDLKDGKVTLTLEISIHALREEGDSSLPGSPPSRSDFYPRPPRGGRRSTNGNVNIDGKISIHALREEGDGRNTICSRGHRRFLSTPSARRATKRLSRHSASNSDFYPRPPRGGRHANIRRRPRTNIISIHALREEGDGKGLPPVYAFWNFYPRPPRGGRLDFA